MVLLLLLCDTGAVPVRTFATAAAARRFVDRVLPRGRRGAEEIGRFVAGETGVGRVHNASAWVVLPLRWCDMPGRAERIEL